jgi:putative hydrolase of HD superfamily
MENIESIKKFLSEMQMLKRVKHEGVRLAGVQFPDSIAEHSLAAAQIAFILAHFEGADPYKCACAMIFHDALEARLGDQHKVSARYINVKEAEETIEHEQLSKLPPELVQKIKEILDAKRDREGLEGKICQDADYLEVAIQAKQYYESGLKGCWQWIENVEKALVTQTARDLLANIKNDDDFTSSWWRGLMSVESRDDGQ